MLFAIVMEVLYEHAIRSGAIPIEQRALISKKRGCIDALLVDRMAMGEAKDSKRLGVSIIRRHLTGCHTNGSLTC